MTRRKKCSVKYCRCDAAPGRGICHKHKSRQWRESKPVVAAFHRLKGHAKDRGISFILTLPEFTKFCADTGYIECRGREADCGSVDRIRGNEPYAAGNIQLRSVGFNSRKQHWDGARTSCQSPTHSAEF